MHTRLHSVPPALQQATTDPRLRQRLLDTPGQVCISLLWGHCSFLLGPGVHKVLFVPSKSLFPKSCVSSGGSMVGLMVTSSKRAYATPRSAAPRDPGANKKPQQDGRRGKITFRIKLHTHQRLLEGSNKLCAHQDPETP